MPKKLLLGLEWLENELSRLEKLLDEQKPSDRYEFDRFSKLKPKELRPVIPERVMSTERRFLTFKMLMIKDAIKRWKDGTYSKDTCRVIVPVAEDYEEKYIPKRPSISDYEIEKGRMKNVNSRTGTKAIAGHVHPDVHAAWQEAMAKMGVKSDYLYCLAINNVLIEAGIELSPEGQKWMNDRLAEPTPKKPGPQIGSTYQKRKDKAPAQGD